MIQITISKDVSDWNETDGQGSNSWCTMDETVTLKPSQTIDNALQNYGLALARFEDVTEDTEPEGTLHRRLEYSQIEDAEGNESDEGRYIANYWVYVYTYAEIKTDKVTE